MIHQPKKILQNLCKSTEIETNFLYLTEQLTH